MLIYGWNSCYINYIKKVEKQGLILLKTDGQTQNQRRK